MVNNKIHNIIAKMSIINDKKTKIIEIINYL